MQVRNSPTSGSKPKPTAWKLGHKPTKLWRLDIEMDDYLSKY